MTGNVLVFNIDEVSLLDINKLIDLGVRFTLTPNLPEEEYDNLEEVLNGKTDDYVTISK